MSNTVTIYHNADCSKSRAALEYLATQAPDRDVVIINYLDTPPSHSKLAELLRRGGMGAHDAIRTSEPAYHELALNETMSDADLISTMVAHPILIQRPIIETELGVVIARPITKIAEVL
ncbi:MAG: arsenate reductase family protein [Corynebacterium sp.]|nr:arsenate reductase family protein [Corynebacterium sp.]